MNRFVTANVCSPNPSRVLKYICLPHGKHLLRLFIVLFLFMDAILLVRATPTVSSVSVSPTSVTGGTSITGTVTLTGDAPAGGAVVTLQCGQGPDLVTTPAASVQANVTVSAYQTQANFTVTTYVVSSQVNYICVGATYPTGSQQIITETPITVNPPSIASVTSIPRACPVAPTPRGRLR